MRSVSGENLVQLLTPEGARAAGPYDEWVADIDGARLQGLYEDMVVVRRVDQEATALQRQGELALWPPLLGQEAAQIGSGRARVIEVAIASGSAASIASARSTALGA